jgi:pSer/pThr/pTyr-binding forkhead associated (FHA) protein
MAECPACGATVDPDANECSECGASLSGTTASFAPVNGAEEAPVVPGGAPAEGPVLVVRKGPQPGERFFIDRPRLTIGRDPESDIFLNDMTVSRTHAVVEQIGSSVTVTDSGSLNGTYVNGVLVDSAELDHGDAVQIGTFQMAFYCVPEGGRS